MSAFTNMFQQWKRQIEQQSPRKRAVIVASIVVLIVAIVSAVLVFVSKQKKIDVESGVTASQKAQRDAAVQQVQHDGNIRDDEAKAIERGDIAGANAIYEKALAAENNPSRKVQLAIDYSGELYNASKYAEAIDIAKKAESMSDDKYLIADWLSRVYEDQRQYSLAAQYYTLAAEWSSSPTNQAQLTKKHYVDQSARMSALGGK